jgi:hypothetical protein
MQSYTINYKLLLVTDSFGIISNKSIKKATNNNIIELALMCSGFYFSITNKFSNGQAINSKYPTNSTF